MKALPFGEALASFADAYHAFTQDAPLPETPHVADPARTRELRNDRAQMQDELLSLTNFEKDFEVQESMRGVSDRFDVPEGAFGREWPKLLTDYLNFIDWGSKPVDECNRLQRLLLTGWGVIPALMLLNMTIRVILAAVALLVGVRGCDYAAVLRPLKRSLVDVVSGWDRPFWWPLHSYRRNDSEWRLALIPFCPAFLALSAFFLWHLAPSLQEAGWVMLALTALAALYAVCIVVALILGAVLLLMDHWGSVLKAVNPFRWLTTFFLGGSSEVREDDLERLVCRDDCPPDESRERRTIRLWMLDMKSKSCNPLQG